MLKDVIKFFNNFYPEYLQYVRCSPMEETFPKNVTVNLLASTCQAC